MPTSQPATETAKGEPSKPFFIEMITRDITLADCIMDLLDNCLDGINNWSKRKERSLPKHQRYKKFCVSIEYSAEHFKIKDNCGGIPIDVAKKYAFRFGRPDEAPEDTAHLLGLYGIGMKRAMFKMGKTIHILSSTGSESFELNLDVEAWRTKTLWDFMLTNVAHDRALVKMGTTLQVNDLHEPIGVDFAKPNFTNALRRSIARVYAYILQQGLKVSVNGEEVKSKMPTLKEGGEFVPFKVKQKIDGVDTEIVAGLSSSPPEDDSADKNYPEAEIYGWYVVCNDRVVITADKTSVTVWGRDQLPAWHNQYYGFVGVVRFDADNPRLLPWKTTKSGVETENPVYQKSLAIMKDVTQRYIEYTNRRKPEIGQAKKLEMAARDRPITQVKGDLALRLPRIPGKPMLRICYDKPVKEIEGVAKALRMKRVSAKEVGIRTFDYFRDREVEK
ncbi:MAG: ATP-binding protein [Nitrospinae bacterium]|nr:ATP-binding protein [Nitrospinota bacterium]